MTQVLLTAASGNWTAPTGIAPNSTVELYGDGGGGGWDGPSNYGSGGGGGGYTKFTYTFTGGTNYPYTVGQGGAGASGSGQSGHAGTGTTMASQTAHGGGGGGPNGGGVGSGGTGSTYNGGNGGAGAASVHGAGGGCAGPSGAGGNASGGSAGGGSGGEAGSGGTNGNPGGNYGGGGADGNSGAPAIIVITYSLGTTTTGSMSMSSIGMAASATGGNVSATGAMSLNMQMAGTDIETFAATGGMTLGQFLAISGTVVQGFPFPQVLLDMKLELLLNGTWTDITGFVYQRNNITITAGRANETQNATAGSMTLTLNNRDGRFSTHNTAGAYYPFVQQNTQIRLSAQSDSIDHGLDYRFWGQVTEWPPQADPSDSDVYVSITANGWLNQLNQNPGTIGSAIKRYIQQLSGSGAPVAYWSCEDPSGASSFASGLPSGSAMTWTGTPTLASDTSFTGSDALPQLNGSSWTGAVPGFVASQYLWTVPGTYTFVCPQGITAGKTECWGAGGGGGLEFYGSYPTYADGAGGGEYAAEPSNPLTPGDSYTVVVGAPGDSGGGIYPGPNNGPGSNGGNSSFSGPGATTVTAHGGGGGGSPSPVGSGGTGSTNTTHHDGGAGGAAGGNYAGGGGSSGGPSSAGNPGSGSTPGSAVTGGGPGGNPDATPSSGPGGGGGGGYVTTGSYPGGNGYAGQVQVTVSGTATPSANVLRFLLTLPSGGSVNGAILGRLTTGGVIARIDVKYGTGGTLQLIGYNSGGTALFTSTAAGSYNGQSIIVSAELVQSGTSVNWALYTITPGLSQTATTVASGTLTSTTLGSAADAYVNVSGTDTTTTGVGHVMVQYMSTSLPDLAAAASGYNGEYAADRFTRLCTEEGISYTLVGTNTDTPQMGPQADDTLINILQGIEYLDQGLLFESRTQFGLSYRTRKNMQNQTAKVSLNYSNHEIVQPLQPVDDEQQTRNDITVTRSGGSSARWYEATGAKSIQTPPLGVGEYTYSVTVTAYADSQLAYLAEWIGTTGTVNEYRYPVVTVDLSRAAVASKFDEVTALSIGDYFVVANTPQYVSGGNANELVFGYTETLNAYTRTIAFNAVPESPWTGGGLPTW